MKNSDFRGMEPVHFPNRFFLQILNKKSMFNFTGMNIE